MLSWPQVIVEQFPLPGDRRPYAPWWRLEWCAAGYGQWCRRWVRSDGKIVSFSDKVTEADLIAQMDRDHPLPHPGIRNGQIWADAEGRSVSVGSGIYKTIGQVTEEALVLRGLVFLVSDQACPWLAPWAPVETP